MTILKMLWRRLVLALCVLSAIPAVAAPACGRWGQWEGFRDRFMSDGGRIVDLGSEGSITTSEGQSYALMFSLIANDREAFDRLLGWTEQNLAGGDLTAKLPAWQWGHELATDRWGILDANPASDADLWIAYALAEAGRLWRQPRYEAMARLLVERIAREEVLDLPGLGATLLPAPNGFQLDGKGWRLNPSYLPLPVIRRLATLAGTAQWARLVASTGELLTRSAPKGWAPEWTLYGLDKSFSPDLQTEGEGSYNAIRVYLWLGMMPKDDPLRPALLKRYRPMLAHVEATGTPPRLVDTRDGSVRDAGPPGFSAALLPFLEASGRSDLARSQRLRVEARGVFERDDNYYDQVLGLFGLGWADGRFRFDRQGQLLVNWKCASG